ncbi:MAG: DegT/DnrJ/EryC1/StrS family aminotransferase [Candidatus Omnitrophica bacterium]|nr:DegT/DnrJ/EryC1/StrS family aminotransferase [Candidatus Omnitrophota bacterium]
MGISFFNTDISPEAVKRASRTLKSTWVSEGKLVKQFEAELAGRLGLKNPVALNSCTSALHLALAVSGVGPGDEVIIPAQTFIATGLAVLMQSAKPVFADIQIDTGNIDPESVRKKITGKTKAIMPVHWGGYPCDLDEINALAKQFKLSVIEDAAHALGAVYKNKPIGAVSRFTAFSFQAIKHLTTADGGALCCMSAVDLKKAMARRWFGIDRKNSKLSILGERQYNVQEVGYKYHMNDLSAAIGLGNLVDFKANLKRRQKIAEFYRKKLGNIPGLKLLNCANDRKSACWLFTLLVEDRLNFIKKLREHGIPASVVHQRIDKNDVFGGISPDLVNQAVFNEHQISIPLHNKLTDGQVNKIVKVINQGW